MQKFQTAITSPTGDIIPNAVITILTSTGSIPIIYAGNGVNPYPTNQVTTNSQGEFSFYAANGRYSYTVAATNFVTEAYTDFLLFDPADAPSGTYSIDTEYQLATAGQTVITLTQITYIPGSNNLSVYVNGARLTVNVDYAETSSTQVTFTNALALNDEVVCVVGAEISQAVDSADVGFLQAGTGAVARTTQSKLRETVSVKDFGAVGDGVTDDTVAFTNAIAASKNIWIPSGTYLVDSVVIAGDGYSIQGESPTNTIIKAKTSFTTNLFSIVGVSSYATNNVVKNLVLDMSNMTDSSSSHGLNMQYAYDCSLEQVNVIGNGTNKRTLYTSSNGSGGGVYTTVFTNCNFSSVTGIIELTGTSLSDATTTLTFVGCSFGQCISNQVVAITFLQPIVQGALNKFVLSNVSGFSIIGGDIEGTGTFLVLGSNVNHLSSANNELSGFSGTYSSGTFLSGYLMDQYGSTAFQLFPNSGTTHKGVITEQLDTAGLTRKIIRNTSGSTSTVDTQITNSAGSTYVGMSGAGDTYVDGRGGGKNTLQRGGTDYVGVDSTNRLIVGTLTATAATAGTNGAPPAQVKGYIRFVNSAGTELGKIPYYDL